MHLFYMDVCLVCMLYTVHAFLVEARRDIGSPETEVTDSCDLPSECWESNLVRTAGDLNH